MIILVVDDQAVNRKLLRVQLESEGHAVLEAAHGLEALSLLERERVNAIVSDILMPSMDGYRFCHEVRGNPAWRDLPFVLYSATYTSPADRRVGLDFGADEFLAKPASVGDIVQALGVARSSPRRPPRATPADAQELAVMREYSERLVRKLEESNAALQFTLSQLQQSNRELFARNDELERTRAQLCEANRRLGQPGAGDGQEFQGKQ